MPKSVLIIDTPDKCYHCPLAIRDEFRDIVCTAGSRILTDNFPEYRNMPKPKKCPLVPMPEKQEKPAGEWYYDYGCRDGWNACLEELEGKKNG